MEERIVRYIKGGIEVKEKVLEKCISSIKEIVIATIETLRDGGKIILFGNGGSASEAEHFVCELVGKFFKKKKALPAIALSTNTSVITAVGNDFSFQEIFSREIEALGKEKDLAIGFSTPGNSENILRGIMTAKNKGMKTVGLSGCDGGKLKEIADICVIVPSFHSPHIQEAHVTIIHLICELVEEEFTSLDT
ncbi:MAG TPA: SIS domain-containing protein [Candidatus Omnitrophica bacterium]|nr:SIS domain-containing protein [Candidatus Omnitrophota bacterium]